MKRGWVAAVLVVAGLLLVAAIGGGAGAAGDPLDPASTAPDGARALVETLERLGTEVAAVTGEPSSGADRALVLGDPGLDGASVREWVTAGGVLVVADPTSVLHPAPVSAGVLAASTRARCAVEAVDGLSIEGGVGVVSVPSGLQACFVADGGAWLVVEALGDGAIVGVGDPEPFLNRSLADADHAAVLAGLLAGEGRVEVVRPTRPGEGTESLRDLVPMSVQLALLQAVVASMLYALVRARRHGHPVADRPVVEVPAAPLTRAVAALRQQAGAHDAAQQRIVADGRRRLALALDVAASVDTLDSHLVDAVAARTGRSAAEVSAVLDPPAPPDEQALLGAARSIHEMIQMVEEPNRGH